MSAKEWNGQARTTEGWNDFQLWLFLPEAFQNLLRAVTRTVHSRLDYTALHTCKAALAGPMRIRRITSVTSVPVPG